MVTAYVLIKANTGDAERLRNAVTACDGVDEAFIIAGDVDLIARATVASTAEVKTLVADELQAIDGVADTTTYIAMD